MDAKADRFSRIHRFSLVEEFRPILLSALISLLGGSTWPTDDLHNGSYIFWVRYYCICFFGKITTNNEQLAVAQQCWMIEVQLW